MYLTLISVCTGSLKNAQCDFFLSLAILDKMCYKPPGNNVINNKNEIKPLNKNNLVDLSH